MKHTKLISLTLALLTLLLAFTGCGDKTETASSTATSSQPAQSAASQPSGSQETPSTPDTTQPVQTPYTDFPSGLTAQKIGSISKNEIGTEGNAALTYKENGKYGILSLDGTTDTGAKYSECTSIGKFFQVKVSETKLSVTDLTTLNRYGIVDGSGKEIIPMQYAYFKKISDRYIQAVEATEQTTVKEEALIYFTSDIFSLDADADDILFKGKWCIYDTVTGKPVTGVSGTNQYQISAYEKIIKYINDAEEYVSVNEKGESIPTEASIFSNGYYAVKNNNGGSVYNSDGQKAFDYQSDNYIPNGSDGDYFTAIKHKDGKQVYAFLDTTGKVVSGEFSAVATLCGDLVQVNGQIYNLAGTQVIDGSYPTVAVDKQLGTVWCLNNGKTHTFIKKDGTVLYQGTEDDVTSFGTYDPFYIRQKAGTENKYYSFAQKDFTIAGTMNIPWLVGVDNADNPRSLVDTISGKTIISGYTLYSYATIPGSAMYIYAKKADGGYDIYLVK